MIDPELTMQIAARYRKEIEDAGCEIRVDTDFKKLKKIAFGFGHDPSPHFDPEFNTFYQTEAFWFGVYEKGECIGYVAVKRQPVGSESLIDFNMRYWKRTYQPGSDNKIKFAKKQRSRLENIKGNLIYGGAWYVDQERARGGIGRSLGKYAIAFSFFMWRDTDFFYILMDSKDVRTGLAFALDEFGETISNAFLWDSHPSQAKADYVLLGTTADGYSDWLTAQSHLSDKT